MTIQFNREQVQAFAALSHDRNPLHVDPAYARATQFGRPVVYGMCAVLLGLGRWAQGRAFRLSHIHGRFTKPLFLLTDYELEMRESVGEVEIRYLEAGKVQMGFRFGWKEVEPAVENPAVAPGPAAFHPLATAVEIEPSQALAQWQGRDWFYSLHLEGLPQLLPQFGLHEDQVPVAQLNALLGSSYLVGMEVPGRQALYSSFDFVFDPECPWTADSFQFQHISAEWDSRFNRISLAGRCSGVRSFELQAFLRPKEVRYSMENILKVAGQSERFKNKVAFVSGASRGFGSVLVRMLALQGAITLINYRTHRGEAEAMVSELGPWNSQVYAVAGDVASAGDCRNMRLEVEARAGRIDLLVGNAFPAIPARGFLAQGGGEFMEFLERSVATIVHLFREMLPIVAREGVVVLVSTRYVRVPEKHFSHYVAAKSCLEGLMRSLALEFPNQTFVIARPPRMLTDQTNLVFDLSPPASAVTVAHELIGKLWPLNRAPNLLEWDLEGKPESGQ